MIGILIVSHCELGRELLNSAEFIVGKIDGADTMSITETTGTEKLIQAIKGKINAIDTGEGVIVLTDMFGGTPSNLSLSFLKQGKIEVLTGVNLPMIISIIQNRSSHSLGDLAGKALDAAKSGIALASKLLESA